MIAWILPALAAAITAFVFVVARAPRTLTIDIDEHAHGDRIDIAGEVYVIDKKADPWRIVHRSQWLDGGGS